LVSISSFVHAQKSRDRLSCCVIEQLIIGALAHELSHVVDVARACWPLRQVGTQTCAVGHDVINSVNHRDTYLEQQQTEKIETEMRDVDRNHES
jgi:hypothetical protein